MGTPLMRYSFMRASASPRVALGPKVMGSTIMPASLRFTLRTISAWRSMGWFLWMMVSPPSRASAMASSVSETVSMAAETSGMLRVILAVSCVRTSVSLGRTPDSAGTRRMSSKLSPSPASLRSHSITAYLLFSGFYRKGRALA